MGLWSSLPHKNTSRTLNMHIPKHTHSLVCSHTIKSSWQGIVFLVLFCPIQISITKSCHGSGWGRFYWKMDRLQNAASQTPSVLKFPPMDGLSAQGVDFCEGQGWALLGQTMGGEPMSAQQSAFEVHHLECWKVLRKDPFYLFPSTLLLLFFRNFSFVQHFLPVFFFSVMPSPLFLHSWQKCIPVGIAFIQKCLSLLL